MGRKKLFEDRAEKIIEVAESLFSHYGFDKTTIDEIAEGVGVSKGSVYLEFESKEEILFAVIAQSKVRELQFMKQVADGVQDHFLEVIRAMMIRVVLETYDRVRQRRRSLESMLTTSHKVRARIAPFIAERIGIIESILEKAARAGEIPTSVDCKRKAFLINSALRGVMPLNNPDATREQVEKDSYELLSLLLAGIKGKALESGYEAAL